MEVRRPFVYSLCFGLLVLTYGAIGSYFIQANGLTADEPAYIGAAYAYSQGIGLNLEHPLLLKIINSFLFSLLFPQIQVPLADVNHLDPVQIRLAAFDTGYQVLMYYPDSFKDVVHGSRMLYLGLNGLFWLWLYSYSVVLKLLDPSIALVVGLLWLFSPSFISHSALIAFDVGVSWSALITMVSSAILIHTFLQKKDTFITLQFIILTLSLGVALNTKFSNLLLIPILVMGLGGTALYLWQKAYTRQAQQLTVGSSCCLLIQPLFTLALYHFAFRGMGGNSLINLWHYYWRGLEMTLVTAKGEQVPFLMGQFRPVTYGQYVTKIMWFKENPALWLLLIMIMIVLLSQLKMALSQNKNSVIRVSRQWLNLVRSKQQTSCLVVVAILMAIYPLTYAYLAQGSRVVIGYRYFYPVILHLYFLVAILLIGLRHLYPRYLLFASLGLYLILGLLGFPQGLSYVSPLWPMPKWLLANDSTLNWGQESQRAVNDLYQNSRLPQRNQNTFIFNTFNTAININQYIEILSKNRQLGLDLQSYYNQPRFDPLKQEIKQLDYDYLLVDSTVLQALQAASATPPAGVERKTIADNLEFLQKNRPIYTHNDIMFLYALRPPVLK